MRHGEETRPRDLFQMLQQLFLVLLFSSSPPAHALAVRPLRHRPMVISMMSSPCAPSHVLKLRGGGGGVASTAAAVSQWYLGKLTTAPLRTKSLTLLCISCLSDTLSQRITAQGQSPKPSFDWHRLRTFSVMGAVFIAPIVHYWFGLLEALARTPAFAGRPQWQVVAAQLLRDQTIAAPVVLFSIFIVVGFFDAAMRMRPFDARACLDKGLERVRKDYLSTLLVNWRLWPLANTLNFWLVPPPLRVLYSNCVSVVWEIYLSRQVNKKLAAAAKAQTQECDGR